MGKKSRLKRERRAGPTDLLQGMLGKRRHAAKDADADFQRRRVQLCDHFARFNAEDVAVALGISDLWLPNISSQVKHHLVLGLFVAMDSARFTSSGRLDTYKGFCDFISAIHAVLPSFPSLEDFIPEADWGEVRVPSKGEFLRIFYGSSVEHIPDFVEAFRIRHESQPAALNDMDLAIALQDQLIASVRREVIGSARAIDSGHVEIPAEAFGSECREALLASCDVLSGGADNLSEALALELGRFTCPVTWSSFGDAVMRGTSLPAVVVRVNGKRLPLSLRNATSVGIDFRAGKAATQHMGGAVDVSRRAAKFVAARLESGTVVSGPLQLVSRTARLPHRFAAVVRTDRKFYFITVVDAKTVPRLGSIEKEMHQLIAGVQNLSSSSTSFGETKIVTKSGNDMTRADVRGVGTVARGPSGRCAHAVVLEA